MRKVILALSAVCLLIGLTACSINVSGNGWGVNSKKTIKGDKNVTANETVLTDAEYELVVEDMEFASMSKDSTPKITINEDAAGKVVLSTDKNILDTISVSVDNNVIKIKGDNSVKYNPSKFDLQINAKVKDFVLNGGYELQMDVPSVTEVTGVINGAVDGSLNFGKLESFSLIINGAGAINLKGETEKSTIEINGAGTIDAFDLRAVSNDVTINGTGTCDVYASDTLNAAINGVGSITYDGNPKSTNNSSGIGSIKKR